MSNQQGYAEIVDMLKDSNPQDLTDENRARMTYLPIEAIHVKDQVRKTFEDDENALQDLAASIADQGVIQPITVRPRKEPDTYELVAGERRLRASKLAGLESIPAVIRDLTDSEAARVQMTENIQRKNLTQIEEAIQIKKDLEQMGGDTEALLRRYNKNQPWLIKRLALVDLGPHTERLIRENLTSDIEVIYGAKGLETKAPELAESFVKAVAQSAQEQTAPNLRILLANYKEMAKASSSKGEKKKKKTFKPKPATMPSPTRKTQPLHTLYQKVVRKKMSAAEAMATMDSDDRHEVLKMVDYTFNLGRASENPMADIIENLRTNDMAGGASILVPFFVAGVVADADETPEDLIEKLGQGAGEGDPSEAE
ncbi:parB-like partition protein (plasmid) [Thioalkalivibrio sp. K90mix]|uniref:ParB/RepB/Spo0J family partition protein n=1 Tax=Thioalkalivibrio sp. (strain K90mix) TaxID=396595 RepID=UPI000195A950|nr:ParB/RepB/Spo0J family partition protein [Thioalkalivibrio sp. K90mix]ADC73364.1 parB-like partition protein [Thioalkalivibrio sp. K90mix]